MLSTSRVSGMARTPPETGGFSSETDAPSALIQAGKFVNRSPEADNALTSRKSLRDMVI
jgi:hypothetical protein